MENEEIACVNIDLRNDDKWIINKYKKAMPKEWKITLWHSDGKFDCLRINFGNYGNLNNHKTKSIEIFNENDTLDDIISYYETLNDDIYYIKVNYAIEGEDKIKEIDK